MLFVFVTDDISHMFAVNHVHSQTKTNKKKPLKVIHIKTAMNHLQREVQMLENIELTCGAAMTERCGKLFVTEAFHMQILRP